MTVDPAANTVKLFSRWKHSPEIDTMLENTEAIVRTAFRHVISKPGVLPKFISKKRDEFLADLVFSQTTIK
jgi:hypothetical protein